MSEPKYDWSCKFDDSPELTKSRLEFNQDQIVVPRNKSLGPGDVDYGFTFPLGQSGSEDDDEETESKIRAFLDEKALELKRLQTPLYEFYNSLNVVSHSSPVGMSNKENISSNSNLPPKSRSPKRLGSRRLSTAPDMEYTSSPGSCSRRVSNIGDVNCQASQDVREQLIDSHHEPLTPSSRLTDSEKEKKWKEELREELERTREFMRQAGAAKT